ncbi:MAG: hypothetical protein JRI68_10245 [Deltaproteobacteria bacterium]|nr:hypothetical protein [Deltaproteobacteria bacterium]
MGDHPDLMDLATIRELRESTTPWQMSVRAAPASTDPDGRHRVLIIVSPGANTIRFMAPSTGDFTPAMLSQALEQAMVQRGGELDPARPPAIVVDDEKLKEAIELPLNACGIEVTLAETLAAIDPVIDTLASHEGLFAEPQGDAGPAEELPSLLPDEHTVAAERVPASLVDPDQDGEGVALPCLVLRVFPANVEPTLRVLADLDALAFLRRTIDDRDAEVIVGVVDDRPVGVVSALGMTHDGPSLGAELASLGADDSEVVLIVATADDLDAASIAGTVRLPRLPWS